jgi:hypothetical protein
MPGMRTETKRGLATAGAALIALITLAALSPLPQLALYYLTNNAYLAVGVSTEVGGLYAGIAAPVIFDYLVTDACWSALAAGLLTFGIGAIIVIGVA